MTNLTTGEQRLATEAAGRVKVCRKCGVEQRHIDSACLFEGERELAIEHNGDVYRLSITRNDKLILTK